MKNLKIFSIANLCLNPVFCFFNRVLFVLIMVCIQAVCFGQGRSHKTIQLAPPSLRGPLSLEQTLAKRRSVREFADKKLDLIQIGQLAWAGQGITHEERGFRTAPSAGALYPIQLYFATQEGLFLYEPQKHALQQTVDRDIREKLYRAALNQRAVADAPLDIIVAGEVKKLTGKYGNKAMRFMLLEAGHIAQNIQLQAVSLELGAVTIGAFDIKGVGRVCRLPSTLEPLYVIPVGYPIGQEKAEQSQAQQKSSESHEQKTRKAVLIIPSQNFRDEELIETRKALAAAEVETVIASTKTGVIKGMSRARAEADMLINDVVVDDYDAVVFIGGTGTREYFESSVALEITRSAVEKGKVLAAICIAPAILANAGVLDGVRATSFSTERVKLKKAGAQFTDNDVERDGLIITAKNPLAAAEFAKTVAQALQER